MAEYIEREALLEDLEAAVQHGGMGAVVFETLKRYVMRQPTADVAPVRHRHWIEDGSYQICSECGEEHSWDEYRATYCEYCGARMDGRQ